MTSDVRDARKNPAGFRRRIAIFLILLMIISLSGLFIMVRMQESLDLASKRFRTLLLPTARLVQSAKTELDLQIQELTLISAFEGRSQENGGKSMALNPHQQTLLRLSPAVQSLLQMSSNPTFPLALSAPFEPWSASVRKYQENQNKFSSFQEAISKLDEIRQQTAILDKNLDREFSVQLLKLDEVNSDYLAYWTLFVLVGILLSSGFAALFWRWIRPLNILKQSLNPSRKDGSGRYLPLPPTSFQGDGLLAPPAEVQALSESVRTHLLHTLEQQKELVRREDKIRDSERATVTLLSALFHLTRHNEELLQKVIKNEKLATMSEMSAQLAHEIRNPLNSMSLKLELLREDLGAEEKAIVDRVLMEVDRLDALTESHLSSTRANLGATDEELCHLESVVRETLELFSDEFKLKGVSLDVQPSAENVILRLPRNVFKSALINLLKNALEAVENSSTREIALKTSRDDEGSWTLKVLDTGPGLPESIKKEKFESFVTYKKQGSGLGLATAQKMLGAYGISLKVFSPTAPYSTSIGFEGKNQSSSTAQGQKPPRDSMENA